MNDIFEDLSITSTELFKLFKISCLQAPADADELYPHIFDLLYHQSKVNPSKPHSLDSLKYLQTNNAAHGFNKQLRFALNELDKKTTNNDMLELILDHFREDPSIEIHREISRFLSCMLLDSSFLAINQYQQASIVEVFSKKSDEINNIAKLLYKNDSLLDNRTTPNIKFQTEERRLKQLLREVEKTPLTSSINNERVLKLLKYEKEVIEIFLYRYNANAHGDKIHNQNTQKEDSSCQHKTFNILKDVYFFDVVNKTFKIIPFYFSTKDHLACLGTLTSIYLNQTNDEHHIVYVDALIKKWSKIIYVNLKNLNLPIEADCFWKHLLESLPMDITALYCELAQIFFQISLKLDNAINNENTSIKHNTSKKNKISNQSPHSASHVNTEGNTDQPILDIFSLSMLVNNPFIKYSHATNETGSVLMDKHHQIYQEDATKTFGCPFWLFTLKTSVLEELLNQLVPSFSPKEDDAEYTPSEEYIKFYILADETPANKNATNINKQIPILQKKLISEARKGIYPILPGIFKFLPCYWGDDTNRKNIISDKYFGLIYEHQNRLKIIPEAQIDGRLVKIRKTSIEEFKNTLSHFCNKKIYGDIRENFLVSCSKDQTSECKSNILKNLNFLSNSFLE